MAWAAVSGATCSGISTTGDTFTSGAMDSTGADFILVSIAYNRFGTEPTLSDSAGNTWTGITPASNGANSAAHKFFWCRNPTTSSTHTFTLTGSMFFGALTASAWTGSAASPAETPSVAGNNAVTTLQAGSITPSEDNELVIAGISCNTSGATFSINGGFTEAIEIAKSGLGMGNAHAYLVQTTAAAANPTWTMSAASDVNASIVSFKAAAGGGGGISAALDVTLGTLTVAGSSTLAIAAALDSTLDRATLAAAAGLGIATTLDVTLAGATLSGAANLAVDANLGVTLGDATLAGASTLAVSGALAVTLGDASLAGAAALAVDANLATTLGTLTLAADATIGAGAGISADLAVTLGDVSLTGSATLATAAELAVTLDRLTVEADVYNAAPRSADLLVTLGDLDLDATATNTTQVEPTVSTGGGGGIIFRPHRHLPGFTIEPPRPLPRISARADVRLEDAKLVAEAIVHESIRMRRRRHTLAVLLS